jgi:hypothetical protein
LGKLWGDTERRVGADVTLTQSWTTAGRLTTQSLTSTSGATGTDHHLQQLLGGLVALWCGVSC